MKDTSLIALYHSTQKIFSLSTYFRLRENRATAREFYNFAKIKTSYIFTWSLLRRGVFFCEWNSRDYFIISQV